MAVFGIVAALAVNLALAEEVTTRDGAHAQNPQWSPDGQWLAFEMNTLSTAVELWLVPVEGGQPGGASQLQIPGAAGSFSGGSAVATDPNWASEPETMMVFEGGTTGSDLRLYFAYPGRGAPAELLSSSQIRGDLTFPDLSGDSSLLAFVSDASGSGDIYIWDINSGEISPIFQSGSPEHFPDFSPNNDAMVFSRENQSTEDLFTWTGGSTTPGLTGGTGDQTRPTWVDDKIVYFTSERGEGRWDIVVTSPQAGGPKKVIATDIRLPARASPAITPDGVAVAYASSEPEKGDRIYFSRLDGSNSSEIATGLVACGEPSLIQTGGRTWMAFTALPSAGSDWRRLHIIDVTGQY